MIIQVNDYFDNPMITLTMHKSILTANDVFDEVDEVAGDHGYNCERDQNDDGETILVLTEFNLDNTDSEAIADLHAMVQQLVKDHML